MLDDMLYFTFLICLCFSVRDYSHVPGQGDGSCDSAPVRQAGCWATRTIKWPIKHCLSFKLNMEGSTSAATGGALPRAPDWLRRWSFLQVRSVDAQGLIYTYRSLLSFFEFYERSV